MYIWVGIKVEDQLKMVKAQAQRIENEIGFDHSNFTLPLHISLKISFPIEDAQYEIYAEEIRKIYRSTKPFEIKVRGLELENNIAWIRMEKSKALERLSTQINMVMLEKYGVQLHEYDMDFKFHTTMFMDDNESKVKSAFDKLKDCPIPSILLANKFVIGVSPLGKLGTYKVNEEINV